jgi:hypothetical protein
MIYAFRYLLAIMVATLLSCHVLTATHAHALLENELLSAAKAASDGDDLIGVQAIESKALAVESGADRQGNRLRLHLSNGATKVYEDKAECRAAANESKCQKYRLIAHARSRGVFVVARLYYESAEYLLVDDVSGDEAVLRRFPVFSSSGKQALVLLMNDEELGFAVQIWRRDGRRFVLDWSGAPHADGEYTSYRLVRWDSENRIDLRSETSFVPPKQSVSKNFSLLHSAKGWSIIDPP